MLKSIKRHINKIQHTGANFLIKKQGINNIKSELIKKIKIKFTNVWLAEYAHGQQ